MFTPFNKASETEGQNSSVVWCRDLGNNERTRSTTRSKWDEDAKMDVQSTFKTRRDKIRNEHIRGTTRVVQASKKITEKRLKWYGHVRRMKEEHIVRRMLDVDIPAKRRRGRPNLRWKDACKRDMTQAGLKEDNATNRAKWRKKLISYTGDSRWRDKPGMKKKTPFNKLELSHHVSQCVYVGHTAELFYLQVK